MSPNDLRSSNFAARSRLLSESVPRSLFLSASYLLTAGGTLRKSSSRVTVCLSSEATRWANLVLSAVIFLIVNCASAWINQPSGSDGQNGGSLTEAAAIGAMTAAWASRALSRSIVSLLISSSNSSELFAWSLTVAASSLTS